MSRKRRRNNSVNYEQAGGGVTFFTVILWILNLGLFILSLGFIWLDSDPILRDIFKIEK